jgi:hypothetical protein
MTASANRAPLPESDKLSKMRTSELHRLLKEYRWVFTVFSQIAGGARLRVKAIQSVLMKRGEDGAGKATPPTEDSLRHPVTGSGITDHALVRYLERVRGIDMGQVEDEMLARIATGTSYYNGAVVVDQNDISYIVRRDGLVVSVMPNEWMSEADAVAAEHALRRDRTSRKDEHYRELASQGIDTSEKTRDPSPSMVGATGHKGARRRTKSGNHRPTQSGQLPG